MYVFKRFSLKNKNCVHSQLPTFLFINYRPVNTTAHYKYTPTSHPFKITPTIYTLRNGALHMFLQDRLLLEKLLNFKIIHTQILWQVFLLHRTALSLQIHRACGTAVQISRKYQFLHHRAAARVSNCLQTGLVDPVAGFQGHGIEHFAHFLVVLVHG